MRLIVPYGFKKAMTRMRLCHWAHVPRIGGLLPRLVILLWMVAVFAGWVILMLPEEPRTPLVSRKSWHREGGFFENWHPNEFDLSSSILRNPESRFFRSWSPETGPTLGSLTTAPFELPLYLSVPLSGSPYDPGISVDIECLESSKTWPVATGHTQGHWFEQLIAIPENWCKSRVRLVGRSQSSEQLVCLGTPFSASWVAYMKESAPVIAFTQLFVLAPLGLIWAAFFLQFLVWKWNRPLAVMGAAVVVCIWGYMNFFLAYFDFRAQIALSMLALVLCASSLIRRWRLACRELQMEEVKLPLTLFFSLALFCVLAVYAVDIGGGGWEPNYRFAPATWSSDNQLQPMIAERLYRGQSVLNWNQHWQTSDRPPLLAGLLLLSRPFWELILSVHDNERLLHFFFQIAAMSIMAFWVVPTWYLIKELRLRRWREGLLILLVALSPFVFFNTIYTWPKLLAAYLGIIAYYVLIQRVFNTERSVTTSQFVFASAAAAMALQAHGGVVFGLVPVALLMLTPRFWPGWKPVLLGAAAAAALLAPWIAWQTMVDPPGNHLIKSAFGGTYGFDEEHVSLWETISRYYSGLTFEDWLSSRRDAVEQLFIGLWQPSKMPSPWATDILGRMRRDDEWYVITSMRGLNLGWLPLAGALISTLRKREISLPDRSALALATIGLAGLLLNCLTTVPYHIIAVHSYFSILALLLALTIALIQSNRFLLITVTLIQFVYMGAVWGISPLSLGVDLRWDLVVGCALAAAMGGYLAMKSDGRASIASWSS